MIGGGSLINVLNEKFSETIVQFSVDDPFAELLYENGVDGPLDSVKSCGSIVS